MLATWFIAAAVAAESSKKDFKLQIAPGLTYQVTAVFDREGEQAIVKHLEVRKEGQSTPVQKLEVFVEAIPSADSEFVLAQDMNFDGKKDLQLIAMMGATGNTVSEYWLYNSKTGKFDHNRQLSEFPGAVPDPKTKTIRTFVKGGHAGLIFTRSDWKWEGGKLVLFQEETQDVDPKREGSYLNVVKTLKNGKLVETSRKTVVGPK